MAEITDRKVSSDPEVNGALPLPMRLENMEHDMLLTCKILEVVVEQNEKYSEYLEALIKREKAAADFWDRVKEKVVAGTIVAVIMGIASASWWAINEFFKGH